MPDDDNEFRGAIVDRLFRATLSTSGVKGCRCAMCSMVDNLTVDTVCAVSKEARELTAFYMKQVVLGGTDAVNV